MLNTKQSCLRPCKADFQTSLCLEVLWEGGSIFPPKDIERASSHTQVVERQRKVTSQYLKWKSVTLWAQEGWREIGLEGDGRGEKLITQQTIRWAQAQNTVPCESWVLFSIISRNNIPQARTREYECENAWKTTDGEREWREGKLSKSHAYKSVELLCAPVPFCSWHCALALAAEQILYESKQVNQRPSSHHQEPSYSRDRHIDGKSKSSTTSNKTSFTATVVLNTVFCGTWRWNWHFEVTWRWKRL